MFCSWLVVWSLALISSLTCPTTSTSSACLSDQSLGSSIVSSCSTWLKSASAFLFLNTFSQVPCIQQTVLLLANCSKPVSHSRLSLPVLFQHHGLHLHISESGSCFFSAPTVMLLLLLHPQPSLSLCTQKCCCKNHFSHGLMLLPTISICQAAEVQGVSGAPAGANQTQAGPGAEMQLLHRRPYPIFFSNIENGIFDHNFKVAFNLSHSCVISHWEFRSWFPHLSFFNSIISIILLNNVFYFYLHNPPYLRCFLCTKANCFLLEIPP